MLEPLDAYRMLKFLRGRDSDIRQMEDVFIKFAHPEALDVGYPIFLLNTGGNEDACVFFQGGRCQIYEARPKVCRLYPFSVDAGKNGQDFVYYQCLDSHAAHFRGSRVLIKEWFYQNFPKEDRNALRADKLFLPELGRLLQAPGTDIKKYLYMILFYRYFDYDPDTPFLPQYLDHSRELLRLLQGEEPPK